MRVLVTGGSGFIGSHVLHELAMHGHDVTNLDVREPACEAAWLLADVDSLFRAGSVTSWSDVVSAVREQQPEVLVHIAAVVDPVLLSQRPAVAMEVNVGGTFNALEAARVFGIRRVVYFSSIGVLPAIRYEPIDADHPVLLATEGPGASFYGAAKVSGEAFCWAYHQSFGLDMLIVRPSAVYGLGMQWPIYIKPIVENAVRGVPTRFDHGREFPRDYTHVSDVAQIARLAVEIAPEDVRDRVFYAATGRPLVTAGELADAIRKVVPGADVEIGSGLTDADRIEIRYRGRLNIDNAREQLGYEPGFGDIADGMTEYAQSYRTYLQEAA